MSDRPRDAAARDEARTLPVRIAAVALLTIPAAAMEMGDIASSDRDRWWSVFLIAATTGAIVAVVVGLLRGAGTFPALRIAALVSVGLPVALALHWGPPGLAVTALGALGGMMVGGAFNAWRRFATADREPDRPV